MRVGLSGQLNLKVTPNPKLAIDVDSAPHLFYQALADTEPQPSPILIQARVQSVEVLEQRI